MSCCVQRSNGAPAGGGAAAGAPLASLELDFSALANDVLVTETLLDLGGSGLDFDVQVANTDVLDIVNGSGLQYTSSIFATIYDDDTKTATFFETTLADIYTALGVDARVRIQVTCYISAQSFTANSQNLIMAISSPSPVLPTGSASRMRGPGIGQTGTTLIMGVQSDDSFYNFSPYSPVAMGLSCSSNSLLGAFFAETWDTDFATTRFLLDAPVEPATTDQPMMDSRNHVGFGFRAASVGAPWTCTIERMLFEAYN